MSHVTLITREEKDSIINRINFGMFMLVPAIKVVDQFKHIDEEKLKAGQRGP